MINLQTTRICWGREVKGGRPCGGILTKWGACWVLVYLDTWCSAANSSLQFPHPFFSKCKNIALEGQNAISSRSAYKQGFFPIDSEKQSPSPSRVRDWLQMGDCWHLNPKYFPAFLCNAVVYLHGTGDMPDVLKSHKNSPPFQLCK